METSKKLQAEIISHGVSWASMFSMLTVRKPILLQLESSHCESTQDIGVQVLCTLLYTDTISSIVMSEKKLLHRSQRSAQMLNCSLRNFFLRFGCFCNQLSTDTEVGIYESQEVLDHWEASFKIRRERPVVWFHRIEELARIWTLQ